MANPPRVYWDACVWLGWISVEPDKFDVISALMQEAREGNLQIVTSSFTLAEVVRRKCDGEIKEAPESEDDAFADLLTEDWVTIVNADWDASMQARALYRKFRGDGLKKPQDALHLATAVLENVDEMHTFDGDDLLKLNGKVKRADDMTLVIRKPTMPDRPKQANLFDEPSPTP